MIDKSRPFGIWSSVRNVWLTDWKYCDIEPVLQFETAQDAQNHLDEFRAQMLDDINSVYTDDLDIEGLVQHLLALRVDLLTNHTQTGQEYRNKTTGKVFLTCKAENK